MPGRNGSRDGFREAVSREELLRSLSAVETVLAGPPAPSFAGSARDLVHLEGALLSWIAASDAASGVELLGDDPAWAADTLDRFRDGQREALEQIRRLIGDAELAESPEEIAHLSERARDAVASAVRLQTRKQRLVARVFDGDLGEAD